MTKQPAYEEVLALATALPHEQLAQLVVVLSELLQKRYGTWTALQGVDEVRDYLEWTRFRNSHDAGDSGLALRHDTREPPQPPQHR
jgi:hypothetical protein